MLLERERPSVPDYPRTIRGTQLDVTRKHSRSRQLGCKRLIPPQNKQAGCEIYQQGWQDARRSADVEGCKIHLSSAALLPDQQTGNDVAANGEKDEDASFAVKRLLRVVEQIPMLDDYKKKRDRAPTVEPFDATVSLDRIMQRGLNCTCHWLCHQLSKPSAE
ncbi:hypothetical protein GCM10011411_19870 [Aurantiacibacter arachoides]|nr:hypothetical protein GCM10011411_19870 [Aurantiacibacter arachoides]